MTNHLPVEPGHEDRAVMGMGIGVSHARRTRYQVAVNDAGLAVSDRARRALDTPLGRVEADRRRRSREDRELAEAAA